MGDNDAMNRKLKISVIIPIYNTAEFLPRCLDSVLGNTYWNIEVICVNDGSTDSSASVVEEFADKDTRIIALNQQNAGVSAARNTGLEIATGDYISFVDSDDWVHPQYFEILAGLAAEYNADCVFCDARAIDHREMLLEQTIAKELVTVVETDLNGAMEDHFRRTRIWGRIYKTSLLNGTHFPIGIKLRKIQYLIFLCFVFKRVSRW